MPLISSSSLFAAGSFLALAVAVPSPAERRMDSYRLYQGTAHVQNWPSQTAWWNSFDAMFRANAYNLEHSCSQFGVPNNSQREIRDIYDAIKDVSNEVHVDSRFVLAVMLEESGGCVRAPTTNYGVRNPGLMQSHNGAGTCNEGGVQNPCPRATIYQMIRDGAAGTSSGEGLVQLLGRTNGPESTKWYQAARMYNSGSIDPSGDLGAGIATHCYTSDIANRLTGWVHAQKNCHLDGAPQSIASSELPEMDNAPNFSWLDNPSELGSPKLPSSGTISPKVPARIKATSNKMAPGVTSNCAELYRVQPGDYCDKVAKNHGINFAALRVLNTNLDAACSNLMLGYDYCVKAL